MNNVVLSITASRPEDGLSPMELITLGRYRMEEDIHVIEYDETELSGSEGTTTIIRFGGKSVSMERSGAEKSLFTIETGKQVVSSYDTPFGLFSIGFLGTKLNYDIAGENGHVELCYHIDMGGEAFINRLELNFHPTGQCC